ncbi:hypothetical protein GB937_003624, partial [Aspergillus fischeri]
SILEKWMLKVVQVNYNIQGNLKGLHRWLTPPGVWSATGRHQTKRNIIIDSPEYHLALVITSSTSGPSALVLAAEICSIIN